MSEHVIDFSERAEDTGTLASLQTSLYYLALLTLDRKREQIVRCRDCKHYRDHEWIIATDVSDVCHFWDEGGVKVEPNGFCKWGERRTE